MPTLVHEVKIQSSGFPGAPGWTTFYFDGEDPTQLANQFRWAREYLVMVAGLFPVAWSAIVQTEGRLLQTATGILDTTTLIPDDGTGNVVPGSNTASGFGPGPTGLCISLTSVGVNRGRRVRGRSYVVPMAADIYESDGTIRPAYLTAYRPLVQALFTDTRKVGIWSRPRLGTGGAFFVVSSTRISDKAAVLTSRRD